VSEEIDAELRNKRNTADMMLTVHSILRDKYSGRALWFDVLLFAVATTLCATTFLDPQIASFFGLGEIAARVVIGVCSIIVFLMSIIALRVDWKEQSARHAHACRALAEIKAHSRDLLSALETRREEEAPEFLRTSALVMTELEPIPDAQFNALRAQHHRKVALSKLHSRYPSAPTWVLRGKLRWRDTRRAIFGGNDKHQLQ
jgi:hypothetical protein